MIINSVMKRNVVGVVIACFIAVVLFVYYYNNSCTVEDNSSSGDSGNNYNDQQRRQRPGSLDRKLFFLFGNRDHSVASTSSTSSGSRSSRTIFPQIRDCERIIESRFASVLDERSITLIHNEQEWTNNDNGTVHYYDDNDNISGSSRIEQIRITQAYYWILGETKSKRNKWTLFPCRVSKQRISIILLYYKFNQPTTIVPQYGTHECHWINRTTSKQTMNQQQRLVPTLDYTCNVFGTIKTLTIANIEPIVVTTTTTVVTPTPTTSPTTITPTRTATTSTTDIPTTSNATNNVNTTNDETNSTTSIVPPSTITDSSYFYYNFPKEILTSLQSIKLLDISNTTMIGGTIPTELNTLPSLQTLILYNNTLTSTIPSKLSTLVSLYQLRHFDVRLNQLNGTMPAGFCSSSSSSSSRSNDRFILSKSLTDRLRLKQRKRLYVLAADCSVQCLCCTITTCSTHTILNLLSTIVNRNSLTSSGSVSNVFWNRVETCAKQFSNTSNSSNDTMASSSESRNIDLMNLSNTAWDGFIQYGITKGTKDDPWNDDHQPKWIEWNPQSIQYVYNQTDTYHIIIGEPCNTISNVAYFWSTLMICDYYNNNNQWHVPYETIQHYVRHFTLLAFGSSFFHASQTKLGQLVDGFPIRMIAYEAYTSSIEPFVQQLLSSSSSSSSSNPSMIGNNSNSSVTSSSSENSTTNTISILQDLKTTPRQFTSKEASDRYANVILQYPITEWEPFIHGLSVPRYSTSFVACGTIVCNLILPANIAKQITVFFSKLLTSDQKEYDFIIKEFQPTVVQTFQQLNIDLSFKDRFSLLTSSIGTVIKLIYAFVFQEDLISGPQLDKNDNTVRQLGEYITPFINVLSNTFTSFHNHDSKESSTVQESINVYPSDTYCNTNSPHSKWHEQSAVGLVDLLYLMNEVYKVFNKVPLSIQRDNKFLTCMGKHECTSDFDFTQIIQSEQDMFVHVIDTCMKYILEPWPDIQYIAFANCIMSTIQTKLRTIYPKPQPLPTQPPTSGPTTTIVGTNSSSNSSSSYSVNRTTLNETIPSVPIANNNRTSISNNSINNSINNTNTTNPTVAAPDTLDECLILNNCLSFYEDRNYNSNIRINVNNLAYCVSTQELCQSYIQPNQTNELLSCTIDQCSDSYSRSSSSSSGTSSSSNVLCIFECLHQYGSVITPMINTTYTCTKAFFDRDHPKHKEYLEMCTNPSQLVLKQQNQQPKNESTTNRTGSTGNTTTTIVQVPWSRTSIMGAIAAGLPKAVQCSIQSCNEQSYGIVTTINQLWDCTIETCSGVFENSKPPFPFIPSLPQGVACVASCLFIKGIGSFFQ